MKLIKIILLSILTGFVIIQFIQPVRNNNNRLLPADITGIYQVPEKVQALFKATCYDCHSNNTQYPWYSNIQPIGWFLARHIKNGKADLNFSEFGSYPHRRQISKLNAIVHSLEDETMPLWPYSLMHKNARLTKNEKALIINWTTGTKDSLSIK